MTDTVRGFGETLRVQTDGSGDLLFTPGDLAAILDQQRMRLVESVTAWKPDELLQLPDHDVVQTLVDEYRVDCPALLRDRAELEPVGRAGTRGEDFLGRATNREQTELVLVVPFDGDREVFRCRASTHSYNPPRAHLGNSELRLVWQGDSDDALAVRSQFDGLLDKIEQHLVWSRADISPYNDELPDLVASLVSKRKSQLLEDRKLEAGLGFPVRRREEASTYAVPVERKAVTATRSKATASTAFAPEPVLSDAHYEEALAILRNARNALERTPSMTASLHEEQIRDLLLVMLNAQLEGRAGGELFNGAGKTDILIRAEDRNIFIAECKIWKGPKTVRDGLDQLLSYLVWRDTKAALLLFIRTGDETAIITKSLAEFEAHPNCKRGGATGNGAGERHDFVFHANGDTAREIHLAFLPFSLRAPES